MEYGDLINTIKKQYHQTVMQLHGLCSINSGTTNIPGLQRMCQALQSAYKSLVDEIHLTPLAKTTVLTMQAIEARPSFGDALFIRKRPHLKNRI